jgi:hypothetical protein
MIAGWAFSVSVSVVGRPFGHQPREMLAERFVDLLEHGARAEAAARSPMPTAWLPCTGKTCAHDLAS